VGLVSDTDVATYKPPPILTFEERKAVVRACRVVDRVVETPAPLHATPAFLDEIGAAFCVHGNDMDQKQIEFWYGALIPSGRIRTVPYSPDISSRFIVQRVIERFKAGTLRST
jgi:glycerol-3-phosphate cytidylyltransferase-like family protein